MKAEGIMWRRSGVGEPSGARKHIKRRKATVALALSLTAGCGSDSFEAESGDAGFEQLQSSTGGASTAPEESVVPVCIDLCKAQIAQRCHDQLTTPDYCGLVCSFFNQLEEACQEASRIAFQCQLDNQPCSTAGCNDLLKAAEAECPRLPEI
jgi:hypothetical protein